LAPSPNRERALGRIVALKLLFAGASSSAAETSDRRGETSSAPRHTGATIGVRSMARTRDYREHLDEVLEDRAEAVAYLNAALAEDDPEVFLLALRDVARTREGGLSALAEAAQLNREHLYRMLSENGNPELRSLEALLDALGFRLSVELKAAG
jgi:probable addiction module antidote protein